jgi:hypothetical protein
MAVFVDQRRERADLLELLAGRHADAGLGAKPAPIIETVLGDKAHAGGNVVAHPLIDLLSIKVVAVGMAQREIVGAGLAIGAVGSADAADVTLAEWPTRP